MLHSFWIKVFYQPIYNLLVFFVSIMPAYDVGLAVILVTLLIKIILFPLTKKSVKSQIYLQKLQPELKKIQETYKDDKQTQAQKTFALYKEYGINPFSGCLPILIQLPVIFALYRVFYNGIEKSQELTYSFLKIPPEVHMTFLSLIDLSQPSKVLAVLAAVTQFIQLRLSPTFKNNSKIESKNTQEAFTQNMQKQMVYMLPVLILIAGLSFPGVVALYFIVSNIVTVIQERIIRRSLEEHKTA